MKGYKNYVLVIPGYLPMTQTFINPFEKLGTTFYHTRINDRYRKTYHLIKINSNFMGNILLKKINILEFIIIQILLLKLTSVKIWKDVYKNILMCDNIFFNLYI